MTDDPLILGIETSCDETAAAITRGPTRVLSNVIATQHELHRRYAGVVPEIASRAHLQRIVPVIREALGDAGLGFRDLDGVAVCHRPGLIGSLLVGTSAAKALAWSLSTPLLGVDHIAAHLHAGLLEADPVVYPALGLVVSGGHTSLLLAQGPLHIQLLGKTIDDAVGEAFDKAATILGLGYPGGPALERAARSGDGEAHRFPVAMLEADSLDFSFSGLKTALLYAACGRPRSGDDRRRYTRPATHLTEQQRNDLAAAFQRAAIAAIQRKLSRALERHSVKTILAGGGVTANQALRSTLNDLAEARDLDLRLPKMEYCVDNAAMIAGLGACKLAAGEFDHWSLSAATASEVVSGRVVV